MDDQTDPGPSPGVSLGLFASLRQLLTTFVAIAHTRLELLGAEVEEQIERLATMVLWAMVALFLAFITIVLMSVAVLAVFWDTYRILAALVLSGLFAVGALLAWRQVRVLARGRPPLFQATVDELARDRDQAAGRSVSDK